jgi:hypothetical protein
MQLGGKSMKTRILITLFILILIITGCKGNEKSIEFKCISVIKNVSYPYDQFRDYSQKPTAFPLDSRWKPVIKKALGINSDPVFENDNDHIWLVDPDLYRYQVSTNKIRQYYVEWNGEKDAPRSITILKNGIVWGIGFSHEGTKPILSRYDQKNDIFLPVIDKDKLLIMEGVNNNGGIVEDSKGRIWISTNNEIFVYDPISNISQRIYNGNTEFKRISNIIAIDKNDGIWVMIVSESGNGALLFIDGDNYTKQFLGIPTEIPFPDSGIIIDRDDQLWVSDYAFWKIGTNLPSEDYMGWNKVIRSSIFITQHKPWKEYQWSRPKPLFEDLAGNIWFTSYGLVKLNKESGEWCRVVDDDSPLLGFAQGPDGSYWMVKDGQLYKYE